MLELACDSDIDKRPQPKGSFESAAFIGVIAVMEHLKKMGFKWETQKHACAFAAAGGHLDVVKWLLNEGCEKSSGIISEVAARWNQFETLQWLVENGCKLAVDACKYAAFSGNLVVLKLLKDNSCPVPGILRYLK